jgi:hypothetical protein
MRSLDISINLILQDTLWLVDSASSRIDTKYLPGCKRRPALKTDNLTAICEPRRLTTLWVSMACYRNRFTFFILFWCQCLVSHARNCHWLTFCYTWTTPSLNCLVFTLEFSLVKVRATTDSVYRISHCQLLYLLSRLGIGTRERLNIFRNTCIVSCPELAQSSSHFPQQYSSDLRQLRPVNWRSAQARTTSLPQQSP